jgi:hypothetical protein
MTVVITTAQMNFDNFTLRLLCSFVHSGRTFEPRISSTILQPVPRRKKGRTSAPTAAHFRAYHPRHTNEDGPAIRRPAPSLPVRCTRPTTGSGPVASTGSCTGDGARPKQGRNRAPTAGEARRVIHESVAHLRCLRASREGNFPKLTETQRRGAPPFRPDQIDSMHKAFEQVRTRMRLTGAKSLPVADLVAIRIVELARAGEFDPDKLTKTVLAEFEGWPPRLVFIDAKDGGGPIHAPAPSLRAPLPGTLLCLPVRRASIAGWPAARALASDSVVPAPNSDGQWLATMKDLPNPLIGPFATAHRDQMKFVLYRTRHFLGGRDV